MHDQEIENTDVIIKSPVDPGFLYHMPALTNGGHELFLGEGYSLIPNLAIKTEYKERRQSPTDEKGCHKNQRSFQTMDITAGIH